MLTGTKARRDRLRAEVRYPQHIFEDALLHSSREVGIHCKELLREHELNAIIDRESEKHRIKVIEK